MGTAFVSASTASVHTACRRLMRITDRGQPWRMPFVGLKGRPSPPPLEIGVDRPERSQDVLVHPGLARQGQQDVVREAVEALGVVEEGPRERLVRQEGLLDSQGHRVERVHGGVPGAEPVLGGVDPPFLPLHGVAEASGGPEAVDGRGDGDRPLLQG
jgi:hypothetical protein